MALQISQSLQQMIDNRFGNGQINRAVLNNYLLSIKQPEIVDKRYIPGTEKKEVFTKVKKYLKKLRHKLGT